MVQGQVMHRAVEPMPWLADLIEPGVQLHEGFLDHVLGETEFSDQPEGIVQQGRFQSREQLLDRLASGRFRAGLVWLHQGHARRISVFGLIHRPGVLVE